MLGAEPRTVTDSSASASTGTVTMPPSNALMSTGRATWPPGSTTITWNGGAGAASQVNRPSASVFAVPGNPPSVTVAPATGLPDRASNSRPVNAAWAADTATERPVDRARITARPAARRYMAVHPVRSPDLLPAGVFAGAVTLYR